MAVKAGWYPDPYDSTQFAGLRFWDGNAWTIQTTGRLQRPADAGSRRSTVGGLAVAGLWRRFFAYQFDSLIVSAAAVVVAWGPLTSAIEAQKTLVAQMLSSSPAVQAQLANGGLVSRVQSDVMRPMLQFCAAMMVIWVIYEAVLLLTAGATLGKVLLGLRVRRPDGGRLPIWSALVRPLVRGVPMILASLSPVIALVAGVAGWADVLAPLFTARRFALHDLAARTVVVRS